MRSTPFLDFRRGFEELHEVVKRDHPFPPFVTLKPLNSRPPAPAWPVQIKAQPHATTRLNSTAFESIPF